MVQINSILDTDLYKLTMQQAVLHQFPIATAKYRFTNRSPNMSFTIECLQLLKQAVGKLKDLTLTSDEKQWLSETCPYLSSEYLDYLEKYRFKPDQVIITFIPTSGDATKGQIEMEANGPWVETIIIKALSLWEEVYTPERGSALWISLTDTFSTDVFFREFKEAPDYVKRWRLRQDSGDPIEYVKKAKALYDSLGVDASEKPIVFSDSLNVVKAKAIQKACDEAGLKASFGIGTFLSNDFQRSDGNGPSKALNMVIKLYSINNIPCVKISDDIGKNTGEKGAVKYVKDLFKIPEA
ncbi:nicotinate phosphoribosyltransferase [Serendipita sp. 400]|nr:nicotinate phosphoribosyltransferase [Serendipita sp. 400]